MQNNPLFSGSMIDSCSFDPAEPEATASCELLRRADAGEFSLSIAHSTLKEIDHPNTPLDVKRRAAERIYSLPAGLTPDEQRIRSEIHRILTGNGKLESMRSDAEHVFEAQKYGRFFITTDRRILNRATELDALCGVSVLKPSAFLNVLGAAHVAEGG